MRLLAFALVALLVACSRTLTTSTQGTSNGGAAHATASAAPPQPPTAVPAPSRAPAAHHAPMISVPTPAPGAASHAARPQRTAIPQPRATATPRQTAILSASVAPRVVHAGDVVSWDVRTTPDVTAVDAHVNLATLNLIKSGPGHFTLGFQIPKAVPPFFHGDYSVQITAHGAGGATATTFVTLGFH